MRISVLLSLAVASAATAAPASPLIDRAADVGFLQLRADSFRALSPQDQELAYWLSQAAIAIDPIIYDQLSATGLRQKRLWEEIVRNDQDVPAGLRDRIETHAKRFWANRGNHNLYTSQKFVPAFTPEELRQAALAARRRGGFAAGTAELGALPTDEAVAAEVLALQPSIFDPAFEPMITAKSPEPGKDIVQASSNTFYSGGVSLADLKDFKPRYALNSRLYKAGPGDLREEVYRAGTPDGRIPPGTYAPYLRRAIGYLQKAQPVARPGQAEVIGHLIRYFEAGNYQDWLAFDRTWVRSDDPVDFSNGFVEIYRDAAGMKGSVQAFVTVTDVALTRTTRQLAANAAYFERHAPWLDQYKRTTFRPPVVKEVQTLIETGDMEVATIGDNLPNENEIREAYGSKNFLFSNNSEALNAAVGQAVNREFYPSAETIERRARYGAASDDLLVALHEVIGHGSGRLSDRLKGGSESYLKEYFSTMEEARADLMALWNIWDPKLTELGLVKNQEEVAKALYDRYAAQLIYQLRQVPKGLTIEEDHMRDRALIGNYVRERQGAIRIFQRDGKTYAEVTDYRKMRAGIGELLAEIMRIKAEGDYEAIKRLVDAYGIHFDPAVRDEVVARYRQLHLPTYWGGVNPRLDAKLSADGRDEAVALSYPSSPIEQYLRYADMYRRTQTVGGLTPAEAEAPVGSWRQNGITRTDLPGRGLAQHDMLYYGEGYNTLFVLRGGRPVWTYSTGGGWEYDDAWVLPNGNVLFTRMQYIAEVTKDKQLVWRHDAPPGTEIHACQPIGLDRVLFIENGLPPRLKVVNIRTGATEVEHELPAVSLTDPKTVHPQYRRVRYTEQGTYLVPMLGLGEAGRVVEYDRDFHEVWSYAIRSPWAALRLHNGNTLITDERDRLTREVNPRGETVWELRPEDLPEPYRFFNTQSCTRLSNGDTIICSRGHDGRAPQLVEVTPEKKVVWVLQDWRLLGPATGVQILDDPGSVN